MLRRGLRVTLTSDMVKTTFTVFSSSVAVQIKRVMGPSLHLK